MKSIQAAQPSQAGRDSLMLPSGSLSFQGGQEEREKSLQNIILAT